MGQLKQLHLFQSCSFTDPAFRSCHSNITLLKFHDWLVGHKNKNDKNPCFFHYFTVQIKYKSRVRLSGPKIECNVRWILSMIAQKTNGKQTKLNKKINTNVIKKTTPKLKL